MPDELQQKKTSRAMEDESGRIRTSQRPKRIWSAMASFRGNFSRNRQLVLLSLSLAFSISLIVNPHGEPSQGGNFHSRTCAHRIPDPSHGEVWLYSQQFASPRTLFPANSLKQ
jgi:hypothetical protein